MLVYQRVNRPKFGVLYQISVLRKSTASKIGVATGVTRTQMYQLCSVSHGRLYAQDAWGELKPLFFEGYQRSKSCIYKILYHPHPIHIKLQLNPSTGWLNPHFIQFLFPVGQLAQWRLAISSPPFPSGFPSPSWHGFPHHGLSIWRYRELASVFGQLAATGARKNGRVTGECSTVMGYDSRGVIVEYMFFFFSSLKH